MIKHREYLLFSVEPHSVSIAVAGGTALQYVNSLSRIATVVSLPPGTYQLIGLAAELTEEQWREIVEWYGAGDGSVDEAGVGDIFRCYDEAEFCYNTGKESGFSLLRYRNLKPETTVVIKEIKK